LYFFRRFFVYSPPPIMYIFGPLALRWIQVLFLTVYFHTCHIITVLQYICLCHYNLMQHYPLNYLFCLIPFLLYCRVKLIAHFIWRQAGTFFPTRVSLFVDFTCFSYKSRGIWHFVFSPLFYSCMYGSICRYNHPDRPGLSFNIINNYFANGVLTFLHRRFTM
jgi:hypothetical protein